MTAAEINACLLRAKEAKIKVYPCNNLRASNIGHACERYLYLLIKHWDMQQPYGAGLQAIFDLGNALEGFVTAQLKEAGLEIITPTQRSWKVENPLITGREDIRIKAEDGQLYPAEIKGLSPYEWERLDSIEDFYESKRHYIRAYPAQLMVYMWRFEKERGFFVLLNKLTGQIKVLEVPFDWDYADALFKKAERIYAALTDESGTTVPSACDDAAVCEGCSLRHICTAPITRVEADIDDGELEDAIDRKIALRPGFDAYNEADAEIERLVGAREKIITGKYLVQVKTIAKAEYTVKAQNQRRVCISRL